MSEGARLAGVFLEPGKTFADIAARPRWWVPMLLLILMASGSTYAFSKHVGWERFIRRTLESNSRAMSLPADRREQVIAKAAQVASVSGPLVAIVWPPLSTFLTAAILLLVFKVAMSAELAYAQALAITAYAFLIRALFAALTTIVIFLKSPYDFQLENPLVFNIGAFLNPERTSKWMLNLATSIDLFDIWIVLLLATGFAAADRRVSWGKAFGTVAMLWALTAASKAVWTGIWS